VLVQVQVKSAENRAPHDDTSSGADAALSGDRANGEDVISGTHLDSYTNVVAGGDNLVYTGTKGVFNTNNGHLVHTRETFARNVIGRAGVGVSGGRRPGTPITEWCGPQHLINVENNGPRDVAFDDLVDRLCLDLGVSDVMCALLGKIFRCGFDEKPAAVGPETDDDVHGFPLAGEGDHLHDLSRLVGFFPVLPTEILGKSKKSGLTLGSNESKILGLRIDVLKGGGVNCD